MYYREIHLCGELRVCADHFTIICILMPIEYWLGPFQGPSYQFSIYRDTNLERASIKYDPYWNFVYFAGYICVCDTLLHELGGE